MPAVKGKGCGGARNGAGRKPKPKAGLPVCDGDSLEFLRSVIKDANAAPALRVRAAIAVAQYEHVKTSDGGKKDAAEAVAQVAAAGRFAPKASPKLVVNNL